MGGAIVQGLAGQGRAGQEPPGQEPPGHLRRRGLVTPRALVHTAIMIGRLMEHPGLDKASLAPHAHQVLQDATLPELPNHYRGKVRDNYDLPDGRRIIITTRPDQRLRPRARRDPLQGAGADPDRALLVRARPPTSARTTSSPIPTRTSWSGGASTSCRWRSWCAAISPARTATSILTLLQGRRARDVRPRLPDGMRAERAAAAADHHADHQGLRRRPRRAADRGRDPRAGACSRPEQWRTVSRDGAGAVRPRPGARGASAA